MHNPHYLILDTALAVSHLRSKISYLAAFVADEEQIVEIVLDFLENEKTAKIDLEYECLSLMSGCLDACLDEDISIIVQAMASFGESVYTELTKVQAYRNGILPFKFKQLIGSDIMLVNIPCLMHQEQ